MTVANSGFRYLLGLVFVILAANPLRLNIGAGPVSTITLLDLYVWLMLISWFLFVGKHEVHVGDKAVFILLCVPAVAAGLSFLWSEDVVSSGKHFYYLIVSLLTYLFAVNVFRKSSPAFIVNSMGLFVSLALFMSLLLWLRLPMVLDVLGSKTRDMLFTDPDAIATYFTRLNNPFLGRSNDFATILTLFAIFFLGVAKCTDKYRYVLFSAISCIGAVLTLSRGVTIVLILALICSVYLMRPSFKFTVVLILSFIFVSASLVYFVKKVEDKGFDITTRRLEDPSEIYSRFERFNYAKGLIVESPFLGYGGGRYIGKDVDSTESAIHNTYLEQFVSYGIPLGLMTNLCLLALPVPFLFGFKINNEAVKKFSGFIAASIMAFLIICTHQTSNEAVAPRQIFHFFLGVSMAYIISVEGASSGQ